MWIVFVENSQLFTNNNSMLKLIILVSTLEKISVTMLGFQMIPNFKLNVQYYNNNSQLI